jgi:hypothetical protein
MTDDPRLAELGQFTPEGKLQPGYGDHYVFFVGRDDCHSILHHLIPSERLMFKFNQFGYDDEELNADIFGMFKDPAVHVQATLDRSQAGGVHERKIIDFDKTTDSQNFNYSFAVGQSETHQISHTKGGVLVGQGIGYEGSMNWSASGEGIGISLKADVANPTGFKAQNNTLMVSTNPVFLARFSARLDVEHTVALQQQAARATK